MGIGIGEIVFIVILALLVIIIGMGIALIPVLLMSPEQLQKTRAAVQQDGYLMDTDHWF